MKSLPFGKASFSGLGICAYTHLLMFLMKIDISQTIQLKMDQESEIRTTPCGEYGYFEVDVSHPCDDLNIQVKNITGEPNLYVSTIEYPTYRSLAWTSYAWGGENLTISSWDPSFKLGRFFIGVHSYCGSDVPTGNQDSKYTVKVKQVPHKHPETDDLFNKTAEGVIRNGTYKRHRFCLPSKCYKVDVTLSNCINPKVCPTTYAWPELIISPKEQNATEKSMAWILGDAERRSIELLPNAKGVQPGHHYITVFGWCTPDAICHDKDYCAPCSYALQTKYNISVIATNICEISSAVLVTLSTSLLLVTNILTFVAVSTSIYL